MSLTDILKKSIFIVFIGVFVYVFNISYSIPLPIVLLEDILVTVLFSGLMVKSLTSIHYFSLALTLILSTMFLDIMNINYFGDVTSSLMFVSLICIVIKQIAKFKHNSI